LVSLLRAPLPPEWLAGGYRGRVAGGADLNRLATPDSAIGKRIAHLRKDHGLARAVGLLDAGLGSTPLYELVAYSLIHDIKQVRPQLSPLDEEDVDRVVEHLLSADLWQRWFFQGPSTGAVGRQDMDRFAIAMGEAVRIALQPLLKGRKAGIRKERLRELLAALNHVGGAVIHDTSPTVARTGAVGGKWEGRGVDGRARNVPAKIADRLEAQEEELRAREPARRAAREAQRRQRPHSSDPGTGSANR